MRKNVFFLVLCLSHGLGLSEIDLSQATSGCVCPGDTLMYTCTVSGTPGGFTIWNGTAFDCAGDRITLRHNKFQNVSAGECNNGAIVARSLSVEGNNYTSQLNVNVTSVTSNKTIMCVHVDGTSMDQVTWRIPTLYEGPILPPNNLHISVVNFESREITFKWNPVDPHCPVLHYIILSSNCGSCPTTTTNTTGTCTDIPTSDSTCIIAIQTVACGVQGNLSSPITIRLTSATVSGSCDCTVSTSLLTTLLILSVTASIAIIVAILMKLKFTLILRKKELNSQLESPAQTTAISGSTPKYEEVSRPRAIQTKENVAYGSKLNKQ